MKQALTAWLAAAAATEDPVQAARAAAEAVAGDPWRVVTTAGRLARCRLDHAERDLSLGAALRPLRSDSPRGLVRVPRGAPYPASDVAGRRRRGAWDTSPEMARRLVDMALTGRPRLSTALDPACGPGVFLVAASERGLHVTGADLDAAALAVARVAVPAAELVQADAFQGGELAELVVGNPPFVPPERQDKALRRALRARYDWLEGRFDLAVPFAAAASERVAPGGRLALVLPWSVLVERYGRGLRRQWLRGARIKALPERERFPGASVYVGLLVLQPDASPAPLAPSGLEPSELLELEDAPFDRHLRPGDVALLRTAQARSRPLASCCVIDTGVVAHGPDGGKRRLIRDHAGPGTVPFADARQFFSGEVLHLTWEPDRMHRPKSLELFAGEKVLVQRLRGDGPIRVGVDATGLVPGHTLLVVKPGPDCPVDAAALARLLSDPITAGLVRLARGRRLDLYPRDLGAVCVPDIWWRDPGRPLGAGLGLTRAQVKRLQALAPEAAGP